MTLSDDKLFLMAEGMKMLSTYLEDGICVLDGEGNVVFANQAACQMLEREGKDIVGLPFTDIFVIKNGVVGELESAIRGEHTFYEGTQEIQTKGGKKFTMQYRGFTIKREGVCLGKVLVFSDMSRARELERMKLDFVSIVSHELRTPLASIKGYVDVLLSGDAGELTQTQREFLEVVAKNNERMLELINGLLDISRIELGVTKMVRREVELQDILDNVLSQFRGEIEKKHLDLRLIFPPQMPKLFVDAARIEQVVGNILSNAIKFTPEGGRIAVGVEYDDKKVNIWIADTGIGIDKKDQETIFDKFYRADDPEVRKTRGTGLGLAICKSIVEKHGGSISVESDLGKGSVFTITLPIGAGPEASFTANLRAKLAEIEQGYMALIIIKVLDLESIKGHLGETGCRKLVLELEKIAADCVRDGDIVAEYKEGVIAIMAATNKEGASNILSRLRDKLLHHKFSIVEEDAEVPLALGCAIYPDDAQSAEMLLEICESNLENLGE